MKSLTFLALFLTLALTSADYTLPNLSVNQDTISCGNVDTLTLAANNDVSRLTSLIQQTIPNCVALLESVHTLVDKAHDLASNVKHLQTLLQTNTESTLMTSFKTGVAQLEGDLAKMEENPISAQFKAKLGEIIDQMNQMATGVTKTDIDTCYSNIISTVVEMEKYLNWEATAIKSQWIDGYLTPRLATLGSYYLSNCMAVLASGSYSTTIPSTSALGTGANKARSQTFTVNFDTEFGNTPSIALALTGWDLSSTYPSIVASVTASSTKSFTITVVCAANTVVKSFQISWIAIDKKNIPARISNLMIDYKDSSSTLPNNYNTAGTREYTKVVTHNAGFSNINTLAFIAGFSFDGNKNNMILSTSITPTDGNGYTLKISTSQDTVLYTAFAFSLSYDANGVTSASNTFSSANGAGTSSWNYGWSSCSNAIVNFYGLNSISYSKGNVNFASRLTTTTSGAGLVYSVNSAKLSASGSTLGYCNPRAF